MKRIAPWLPALAGSAFLAGSTLSAGNSVTGGTAATGWPAVEQVFHQQVQASGIVGSSNRDGWLPGCCRETRSRCGHNLSLGVDHENIHRHRDHAAARSRPSEP